MSRSASTLVAEVNVGEVELKNVYVGREAEIITEAQREKNYKGVVREIAEQADRAKGTVLVNVDLEATKESVFKPGMAIQVRFKPRPRRQRKPRNPRIDSVG